YRIEPGEIETTLTTHPTIAQATVIARTDPPHPTRLVAYVVPTVGTEPDIRALRQHVAATLPDYMVPAAIAVLPALPVTPNGKLDRGALPPPDLTTLTGTRQPSTANETVLCQLFADILDLPTIGTEDNFFELGGDSIMSIQLTSRARQAGIVLSPQDVFRYKTVADLAAVAKNTSKAATEDVDAGLGRVQATPVMQWLGELGVPIDSFHQAMLLRIPAGMRKESLVIAVQEVLDHHDLLRSRLHRTRENELVLEVMPRGSAKADVIVSQEDIAGLSDDQVQTRLTQQRKAAGARLAPEAGVMMNVTWFDTEAEKPDYLLLVVHRLVIDEVSWRLLVLDLASAWEAVVSGRRPELQPVGSSFRQWSQRLTQEAHDDCRVAELALWQQALDGGAGPVLGTRPLDSRRDTVGWKRQLNLSLPVEQTAPLLTKVPTAFHAGVDDVLLTALALAVSDWRRCRGQGKDTAVLVNLEGNGREATIGDVDLSRTIGWFTTIFPVRLDAGEIGWDQVRAGGPAVGDALKRVKEQLRAIPDNGIGYGLLRYVNPDTASRLAGAPVPQILFNYLGHLRPMTEVRDWRVASGEEILSSGTDPEMPLEHALEINASTEGSIGSPRLKVTWSWPDGVLAEDDVRELADRWVQALAALAAHAARPGAGGHTPSDFPLISITQPEIAELEFAHPGLADLLPLSPLQAGLLFHARFDEQTLDFYIVQHLIDLTGPVRGEALRRAAQALLERHPNLGASFVERGTGETVQVVRCHVRLPWQEVDLSDLDEAERAARIEQVVAEDRFRRFDLTQPPLWRATLLRLSPHKHRLVLTIHHILLDGWSVPIMLQELLALYSPQGQTPGLPPVTPYREYLAWLTRQDREAAQDAWQKALGRLEEPSRLTPPILSSYLAPVERLRLELPLQVTVGLPERARAQGVTMNTIVQLVWGLLIGRMINRDDVVFGTTVSGRSPQIPGIESMVGLFINTVPVRVRWRWDEPIAEVLARLQDEQSRLLEHHHLGLVDIQRLAAHSELFDTLVVFENLPLGSGDRWDATGEVEMVGTQLRDATHYPLTLVALPEQHSVRFELSYRPDVLDQETAEDLGHRLVRLLTVVVADPGVLVGDVGVLLAGERSRLVVEWNDTVREVSALPLPGL
ncbi:MAG: condensation domain-containing protein, partial [Pseudonocardiales bacterium]